MNKATYKGRRRIGTKEMMAKLEVSRGLLMRMVKNGVVPKPARLGAKLGWDSVMVQGWLDDLVSAPPPAKSRLRCQS